MPCFFVADNTHSVTSMAIGYCMAKGIPYITVGDLPGSIYLGAYVSLTRQGWKEYVEQLKDIRQIPADNQPDEHTSSVSSSEPMVDLPL